MAQDQPTSGSDLAVRLFLTAIGGGFCSQPIAEISNGGNNYKRYIFSFVVGFLFFLAGATWPSLKSRLNVGLANSLNQCANDARAWFVLISIAWIYSFAPGLLLAIRGEPSFLSLASEVETMQKDMTRYVMPRHITPEQSLIVAKYLKKHAAQTYAFAVIMNDREADQLRAELETTLKNGGWKPSKEWIKFVQDTSQGDVAEGISVSSRRGGESQDPEHLDAQLIFMRACQKAHIDIVSSNYGGGPQNAGLLVIIGRRPRDDQEFEPQRIKLDNNDD